MNCNRKLGSGATGQNRKNVTAKIGYIFGYIFGYTPKSLIYNILSYIVTV